MVKTDDTTSASQLINYIQVYKARCKRMVYHGRLKKKYEVLGTTEYYHLKELREKLADKMGIDKN